MSELREDVVIPWWQSLGLRREILDSSGTVNDVEMSLDRVANKKGAARPLYAKPSYYGEITHPTAQLTDFLARIAVRLSGTGDVDPRPIQLHQSMGGGKSHACIGAYHLAKSPREFFQAKDVGPAVLQRAQDISREELPLDLHKPHVVVLSCDSMTPGPAATVPELDGPVAASLYERFLHRLVGEGDAYDTYAPISATRRRSPRPSLR